MTPRKKRPQKSTTPRKSLKAPRTEVRINVDEGLMSTLESRFSLSTSEARVYTTILVMGQLTPYEIGVYSGATLTEIESSIESLLKKNLIKVIPGIVIRYRAFAPYKDLADVVSDFQTHTTTALDELQTTNEKVRNEISSKFGATSSRIESDFGKWMEQQSTTINDVLATTKTMQDRVIGDLLKALTSVSNSSCNGFSSQTTLIQQNLEQTLTDCVKQIEKTFTESLKKTHEIIEKHQVESEQWLASSTNQISQQLDAITNQFEVLEKDTNSTIKQTLENETDATTTNLTNQIEGARQRTQKAASTITKGLETLGETTKKVIDDTQTQQNQTITKAAQDVNQRFRQAWTQRFQSVQQTVTDIDKVLSKESKRLKQEIDRSTTNIHTTIETASKAATQIADRIRQNLKKTLNESQQLSKTFQKETEAAIAKWLPTALEFSQITNLKENLVNLTQQISNTNEKLLKDINKTLFIEIKGVQQDYLGKMWTLFEQLNQDLISQQSTLTMNAEETANRIGKTMTARLANIQKMTTSFLKTLQKNVQTQENETSNLKKEAQTLIKQIGASLTDSLSAATSKIDLFGQEQCERVQEAIEELGNTSLAKTSRKGQTLTKQLNSLEKEISKKVNQSIQSLQQNLDQLQGVVREYAGGVETTSDKLREEQKWQLETAMKAYRNIVEEQQTKRDKSISKVFQSTIDQMSKSHNELLDKLENVIQEQISQHTSAALENYRAKINEQNPVSDDRAIMSFKTTLRNLVRNQLLANLKSIMEEELQVLKDNMTKTEENIVETIHQTDSYAWQQAQEKWTPVVEADEQFASTLLGNLTALNIAINTSLDEASQSIHSNLNTLQDETMKALTTTSQALSQQTATLDEQVTQGITEMKEGCLNHLGEMQGLLNGLSQDLTAQQSVLAIDVGEMVNKQATTFDTCLVGIQKVTTSFQENIESETKLQKDEANQSIEDAQAFIKQQSLEVTDILGSVAGKFNQFSQEQITQVQKSLDELWDTNKSRIEEYRKELQTQFNSFAEIIVKQSDEYMTTLQEELTQLHEQIRGFAKNIGATNKTTTDELKGQIDAILMSYTAMIEEQQRSLDGETSSVYQSTSEVFEKTRSDLVAKLSKDNEEAQTILEKEFDKISTKLEEMVSEAKAGSQAYFDEQKALLTKTITDYMAMVTKGFNDIHSTLGSALDQTIQTTTTTFETAQNEVDTILTTVTQSFTSESEKLKSKIEQGAKKSLQTLNQELELTKSSLDQITQDVITLTSDSLNNVSKTASTDIYQQRDNIVQGIKQFNTTVEDQLVTETEQALNRLGHNLGTKRRSLIKVSKSLVKEITKTLAKTEETSLATLSSFAEKAEPTLKLISTNAGKANDILMGLWNALVSVQFSEAERTWHIVTHESIQTHLKDMLHRTKDTITLVYPSFDKVPIEELKQVEADKRIHLVTSIDEEEHKTKIQSLQQQGNVRIWHNPSMEFYAGARDCEEILIAPIHGNPEEIVAVVSDQENYVALFNRNLGPRWISSSKEILRRLTSSSS